MLFIISLIFLVTNSINGLEDFNIHLIDSGLNRIELYIDATKIGNSYHFRAVTGLNPKNPIASAILLTQMNITGWNFLQVNSYADFPDEIQAYYAGVNEGLISRTWIDAHFTNTYKGYCAVMNDYCKKLQDYLTTNLESMITKSRGQSGYWKMVRLMLWQIKGIQDGFDNKFLNNSANLNENYLRQLKNQVFQLYLLQLDGDLSALSAILGGSNYHATFPGRKVIGDGSCSAFIKYVKGDIFASHVTWSPYNNMLRIAKYYNFPYRLKYAEKNSPVIPGSIITFSSYPGLISSVDDFYITSGGLVTTETTIGNYNQSLFDSLKNRSASVVFEYLRVQISNRLTTTGYDWASMFSDFNSGTYNNQWMILDAKKMKNHKFGNRIPNGVLYILEQIPGNIQFGDRSSVLDNSYWASYNIPYFTYLYNLSGYEIQKKQYGDFFSYEKSPRAQIFKRDAPKVTDRNSLFKLMRYNDFKNDPLAKCACNPPYSGENGISARSDLNLPNGTYPFGALGYRLHGGLDLKAVNLNLIKLMKFEAISSPTYDQQPAFDWTKIKDPSVKHNMQPNVWKFGPILTPFPLT